jgi:hypothetical protein
MPNHEEGHRTLVLDSIHPDPAGQRFTESARLKNTDHFMNTVGFCIKNISSEEAGNSRLKRAGNFESLHRRLFSNKTKV